MKTLKFDANKKNRTNIHIKQCVIEFKRNLFVVKNVYKCHERKAGHCIIQLNRFTHAHTYINRNQKGNKLRMYIIWIREF